MATGTVAATFCEVAIGTVAATFCEVAIGTVAATFCEVAIGTVAATLCEVATGTVAATFCKEGLDFFEGGAVDEAAHVCFRADHMAGLVGHKSWGESAEGLFADRLLSCPAPFDLGADAAGLGVVTGPVELGRPGGGFAVFVVEVEEGPVFGTVGCLGQLRLEKLVESVGGGRIDLDLERDGLASPGCVDPVGAGGHILKFCRNFSNGG